MNLRPLLSLQLRPKLCCWLKQARHIRPNIKVAKDKFQLQLDVKNFNRDEIRVKARPEYVIIEGKQEKRSKTGLVLRQFTRKFKLPPGCTPDSMQSRLSPDGVLTIIAPRKYCEEQLPCETLIPITATLRSNNEQDDLSFVPVQDASPKPGVMDAKDPCTVRSFKSVSTKKPSQGMTTPPSDSKKP